MSSTELTPRMRAHPAIDRVLSQVRSLQSRNRDLRRETALALPPLVGVGSCLLGGALHGAARAYAPDRAEVLCGIGGIGAVVGGAYAQRPELVELGKGLLAPLMSDRVWEQLVAYQQAHENEDDGLAVVESQQRRS